MDSEKSINGFLHGDVEQAIDVHVQALLRVSAIQFMCKISLTLIALV